MKKRWFILLIGFFAHFSAIGQSPLDATISLDIKDLPIKEVLYEMIDQGVKLSFNNNILPVEKKLSFRVVNLKISRLMPLILADTDLSYEVVGSQIVILKKAIPIPKKMFTLSGFVTDAETGERNINSTVYDVRRKTGTYTNEFGYFSITLSEGPVYLQVSSLGYENDTIELTLASNQRVEIQMRPLLLAEVVVKNINDSTYLQSDFNTFEINLEQAGRLPSLGGETDVMRLAYTLPGIQTGADGFGGMSVRGGDIDQNLFLLDGVTVYNATHGLGIYSIYNTGAVRSAKILKGDFPAQYGGRTSSIWDIQTKEGNLNKLQGEMEMGPTSLQTTIEGPFTKHKGSWFLSGRRALFDFFSVPISKRIRDTKTSAGYLKYFFFDINAKFNYKITPSDRVYLSFYHGKDDFVDKYDQYRWFQDTLSVVSNEEVVNWGNNVAALRWNHLISDKIFANVTATYSRYFYNSEELIDLDLLSNDERILRDVLFLKYKSSVEDIGLKTDFDYTTYRKHRFRFGTSFTKHKFQPGVISFEELTVFNKETRDTIGAYLKNPLESTELDAYVQDELKMGNIISANIGLRASALLVNQKEFFYLQPRLILRFWEDQKLSFNFAITKNTQSIHLLSPTSFGLPKDLWVSATDKVKPQQSWQYSVGGVYHFQPWLTLDIQGYYKKLRNIIYFQGNGLNNINSLNWQDLIAVGNGWAYGTEFLLKIQRGKFGGWAGYSYAHADRKFGEEVNNGKKYPLRLDRRHNFNLQFLYKINSSWDFSLGYVFSTGSAYTLATQQFDIVQQTNGSAPTAIKVSQKFVKALNDRRLPNYHRLDFTFNHYFKVRNVQHTIKLGVYNAYLRKNPVYYTLRESFDDDGQELTQVVQISLLPFFPTLRYIMEFK
ncbi:MAG: TonB-dependent receptor plug domain-containing protein [Bacteroidetes bacterium]|nr:TonB-dependent receptor plug domain-containing protein [Bacteroidota bacterium]